MAGRETCPCDRYAPVTTPPDPTRDGGEEGRRTSLTWHYPWPVGREQPRAVRHLRRRGVGRHDADLLEVGRLAVVQQPRAASGRGRLRVRGLAAARDALHQSHVGGVGGGGGGGVGGGGGGVGGRPGGHRRLPPTGTGPATTATTTAAASAVIAVSAAATAPTGRAASRR